MNMWIIYHWIYSMVMEFLALYHEYITKLIFFLNCYSIMRMYLSSHIVHVYLYIPLNIHHISIISHKISHTATIQTNWDGIFHLSHQHHQQFLTISHDFPWFPILSHVLLHYSIDPIVMHPGRRRGAVADCLGHLGAAPQWLGKQIYVRNSYNVAVGFSNYMTQLWLINTNDVCWTLLVYN